jgi:uncharacterized protein YceK
MKLSKTLLLKGMVALVLTAGCAAVDTLTNGGEGRGIYSGVREDIHVMKGNVLDCGSLVGLLSMPPFCCGMDLPFSAAVDTLALPFTVTETLRCRR